MRYKNKVDVVKFLKVFESKKTPENGKISLMYESAIHYDMYSVYIKDDEGNDYLFDSYSNGIIKVKKWNHQNKTFNIDTILKPERLTSNSFSGIYYYHAHELKFDSLDDLSFFNVLRFRRIANRQNKKLSREKYLYRQRKQEITDVMTVLAAIVRIYREQQGEKPFSETLIMNDVAGRLWIYHDDYSRLIKELRLCLDSLVESGDISKTRDGYKPTGKAINTLNHFNNEEQRYNENIRSQKSMFWATLFAAIDALGSMTAAFIGLMK
ncbi:hypothetical protein M9Z64_000731 [Escherichia coli]|nr:hypothetical protein [Escherichia coli]